MKLLSLIALLILASGCKVSKNSVKKKCVIQEVERDFSECERYQNNQTAAKETVKVSIDFSIDLQDELNQMEILGNYYDQNYSQDGRECRVEVYMGTRWDLRKSGNTLTARDGGRLITYTRKGSRDQGYLGGWYRKSVSGAGSREEFLTLHNQSRATLTVECHFN